MSALNRYKKSSLEERLAFPEKDRIRFDIQIETERKNSEAHSIRLRQIEEGRAQEKARLDRVLSEARRAGTFPEGYQPVFHGVATENPVIVEGRCILLVDRFSPAEFHGFPVIPLRGGGAIFQPGDHPTLYWAVDADGGVWFNSNGNALESVDQEDLDYLLHLLMENYDDLCRLHSYLGRKPPLREWMKEAFAEGWSPPESFDRLKYES